MTDKLNYDQALHLMERMLADGRVPEVFCDGGWDGSPMNCIEITDDGDGQNPLGSITPETLQRLKDAGMLGGNIYGGAKSRKLYSFKGASHDR